MEWGENGRRIALSVGLVIAIFVASWLLQLVSRPIARSWQAKGVRFWLRQGIRLAALTAAIVGIVVIWHADISGLAGAAGLITAGIAVALQRVITSFAAYLILLRGKVFTVGDRITIGGVRGDVVALDFMQTTVLEMGQATGEQHDPPSQWIAARQYTGRLVRITNDKIFDTPVYNYTRVFPYIWEELHLPISYKDDRRRAEQILLDVARRHTAAIVDEARLPMEKLQEQYRLATAPEIEPRVYWRLTDNWVELSLRFMARVEGVRGLKDAMSRDIIDELDRVKIGIASGTYEIVGVPPIHVIRDG